MKQILYILLRGDIVKRLNRDGYSVRFTNSVLRSLHLDPIPEVKPIANPSATHEQA